MSVKFRSDQELTIDELREVLLFMEGQVTTDKFVDTKLTIDGDHAKISVSIDEDGNVVMLPETRKSYKVFPKKWIGVSDIASLVLVGCDKNGVTSEMLHFGEDGQYYAYIVNERNVVIGSHYKLRHTFEKWLKIYDDDGLRYEVKAAKINIYRAGDFGCIIEVLDEK